MSIKNQNVKLYESQRLSDQADGGGRMTGTEVLDTNVNNLFQDISRIDRTIGDVALRKAFIGIDTDNNDAYLGSHLILTEPPADPNVSVLLFNTSSLTDERAAARNRIEAYVVPGTLASFDLLGVQLIGQRSITVVQREEQALPEVGEVYRLYNEEAEGEEAEQYIRITNVEHRLETYTVSADGGYIDFQRRRVDMDISAPLAFHFPGGTPTPSGTTTPKSLIQTTQIADASRYYGIKKTQAAISQGDLTVKVESIYAPLVPSAKVESPLLDQYGGYTAKTRVAASNDSRSLTCQFSHVTGHQSRTFLQSGALPGSITLTLEGGTYNDDSNGGFVHSSGVNNYSQLTVDYDSGEINVWRNSSYTSGSASANYTPAAGIVGAAVSNALEITTQNRGFNYTLNLAEAKPKPGTLVISYIALGKWQDISDPGNGLMRGSGTGAIDFATGTVAVTLNAMPDPDSALVYSYVMQNDDETAIHTGTATADLPTFRHTTEKPGILPGSLTVTYISNGQNKILTDQGTGILGGDGNGTVYYASGELALTLNGLPDNGTSVEISYQEGEVAGGVVDVSVDSNGVLSGTITGAPLLPGSVQVAFVTQRDRAVPNAAWRWGQTTGEAYTTTYNHSKSINDNTAGGWQGVTGAIDYQSGEFTLQSEGNYHFTEFEFYTRGGYGKIISQKDVIKTEIFSGSTVTAKAQHNSLSHTPFNETLTQPELTIDLLTNIADPLIPGSLIVQWKNDTYFDRDGLLYKNVSTVTNAGISVGTIDYTGGVATFTHYPDGEMEPANIVAAATISAGYKTDSVSFRTAGAPIRPGSLQLTAIRADNADTITATSDFSGIFNTDEVQGKIDSTTGWCQLSFTDGVDPIYVIPQTVRYNGIVETSLPLDAELIGLDPVRLPPDGRVPIYRPGDIVVINHTGSTEITSPVSSHVINLARDHQADIIIEDSNGSALDATQYTVDKEAGQVTLADPLSLIDSEGQPLTEPLIIKDRVEHMSVVSDVQINGDLSIIAAVPWDLPAGETTVSSAIVYGDLQARVSRFFSQKTWEGGSPNWTDAPSGQSTTAQYNTLNYPITPANNGAINGKWAIVFTSNESFQVVEETLGIIATGNTLEDVAPINPETGTPYFTIRKEGWGAGWATANAIRFNTNGCLAPVWICRTVLAGQGTEKNDKFTLQIRGDAD